MARQKSAAPQKRKKISKGNGTSDAESVDVEVATIIRKKVRWESQTEESTVDSDVDDSVSEKVCAAVWCQNGRVGCAYYDPVKCFIYLLEDSQESLHFDLTQMFLEQVEPDILLTSSKADDGFIDTLRRHIEGTAGIFQIRPHKDFVPAKGRDRLFSLRLLSDLALEKIHQDSDIDSSMSKNAYDFMRNRREVIGDPMQKRWNASIKLSSFASVESSPLCLASVGALLDYLVQEQAVSKLDDEGLSGLDVRDIVALSLDDVMQINADTLYSLQIFDNESHASMHSDKTKEGLSLFGILNNTKTTLGRALLRTWLMRPSLSIPVISARHDAVACFLLPENITTANVMHSHLKGIKNVPRILGAMRTGRARVSDWQGLMKFTFYSAMLRDSLAELHQAGNVEIVKSLIGVLDIASFKQVGVKVNETIDWEESANAERVCVRPHIDEDLDNRKHVYHGIDSVLSNVAEQISQTVPSDYAASLNVVYFPQLGFLICVPMLEEWQGEEGIKAINDWSFQFSSESYVYFKSQEMHDMDTHIGDLHPSIVDRELEIIQDLLEEVLIYSEAMGHACDVCAELDCLLSFSGASRAYEYRRPQMVEDNIINITQGRHPLQEQVVATFVPNDTRIVGGCGTGFSYAGSNQDADVTMGDGGPEEWNSILISTGANACGKSVYLKQVALILFMAQIGCFVPAESATLGIVDKIFTRISTRESVSKVQSAFMIDLNQVSLALRNATPRSLILLDEFGKGTVSTDGAGLFCGVLKHLLDRGSACPKVLATTHFHDIFRAGILDPASVPITFLHMKVLFTSATGEITEEQQSFASGTPRSGIEDSTQDTRVGHGEKITYLYRVAQGLSLDSHAAKCAEMFGIPERIVERARYVSHLLSTHELGQLLDEAMTTKERCELEDAEEVCRRFLAWDLQAAEGTNGGSVKVRLGEVLGKGVPA